MKSAAALFLALLVGSGSAAAQTRAVETTASAGASTEDVAAGATQIRAFGDAVSHVRFFAEASWGARSDDDTDAFGAAYPYSNRMQVTEAYGERVFEPRRAVVDVRAGRFRTPFGISSASEHAYGAFLRAPLIRYDGYFALSNNYLEQGADVVAGIPQLLVEGSVGRPADIGTAIRRPGDDTTVRVQASLGSLIVGASRLDTNPYLPATFAKGRMSFTGVDARWMRSGVELRGEWITGQPFDGTTTSGWYADAIVHRVAMGPVTAVARVERLDYDTVPAFALHARREVVGARVQVIRPLAVQVDLVHQTGAIAEYGAAALDVGVTFSARRSFVAK